MPKFIFVAYTSNKQTVEQCFSIVASIEFVTEFIKILLQKFRFYIVKRIQNLPYEACVPCARQDDSACVLTDAEVL